VPDAATPEAPPLRTLALVLTAGCNLGCTYCFQDDKKPRNMNGEILRASLDFALDAPGADVDLVFFGGEPLLAFPRIREAVDHVNRRGVAKRVRYSIITNGTLMKGPVLEFLVAHDFDVQISFDGVPAAQALRGEGTFAVLDRLLQALREDHPKFLRERVSVGITLLPRTVPLLADSIAYFLDRDVPGILVSPTFTDASDWRLEDRSGLEIQFARIYRLCLDHYHRTGRVPLKLFRRDEEESIHRPRARSMCGAPTGEAPAVDVDGSMTGCVTFAGSYQKLGAGLLRDTLAPLVMGPVDDPGLPARLSRYRDDAARSELFADKQDKYSGYGNCRDCRYLDSCGICPVSIGNIPGNRDPRRIPDFLCAFNLVSLKYRDLFPIAYAPRITRLRPGDSPNLRRLQPLRQGGQTTGV